VNRAAIARGHGIERKGLARLANALSSNAGGKLQFFETVGAEVAALEADMVMERGRKTQPAMREVFEGEKEFAAARKENFFIFATELDEEARFVLRDSTLLRSRTVLLCAP
jgi:hypothetical protein